VIAICQIKTKANTDTQTKANNEYLSKQLEQLKIYEDLPIAIEKAMGMGTAGAILRVKYAKVDKKGNLLADNRTKLDIIYVGANQIIPLKVEHGQIIDIAIVSENTIDSKKEYFATDSLSIPIPLPTVIVIPDLETPGKAAAIACDIEIKTDCFNVISW